MAKARARSRFPEVARKATGVVMRSASDDKEDLPPSFVCPLTLEPMTDPVTAADGHSYECEAITKWLRESNLSPLTGEVLPHKRLTRSHALRNAIQEHQQAQTERRKQQSRLPAAPTGTKVILLGDSGVGKSSLVHRLKEGTFTGEVGPTIGCSFCTHSVALPDSSGKLSLAIWDTAGQEKYRSFTRQYFRGAAACVVLYDITSLASFEGAKKWLDDVKQELGGAKGVVIVLVGAKLDCAATLRQVSTEQGQQLAAKEKALHLECSSKDGTNVDQTFENVARLLVERGLAAREGSSRALTASGGLASVQVMPQRRSVSTAGGCSCQTG